MRSGYACSVSSTSLADARDDAELLGQLAREARLVRFARLALAAGKLPQSGEVRAAQAARQQESPVAFDDRGEHDDRRRALSGHARG